MNALMEGLELPPKLGRGRPSQEQVEPWIEIVEVLLGRGVRKPGELASLLGVHRLTAQRWLEVVEGRWASGLSAERLNWRREKLFAEADEVARYAWEQAMEENRGAVKAQLLRIVLESNKRKAALCGLDSVNMTLAAKIETHTRIDVVASVEADLSLAPGALARIGRQAAVMLSAPPVIDVEASADE